MAETALAPKGHVGRLVRKLGPPRRIRDLNGNPPAARIELLCGPTACEHQVLGDPNTLSAGDSETRIRTVLPAERQGHSTGLDDGRGLLDERTEREHWMPPRILRQTVVRVRETLGSEDRLSYR